MSTSDMELTEMLISDREPNIFVNETSVVLSSELVRQMNVKTGDKIQLMHDMKLGDYYLKKSDNGLPLKSFSHCKNRLALHSRNVSKILRNNAMKVKHICEKKEYNGEAVFLIFTRKNYYGK